MTGSPFGANTLIIPFTWKGRGPQAPRVARMSRMRPAGELFRNGVVNTVDAQQPTASPSDVPSAAGASYAPVPPPTSSSRKGYEGGAGDTFVRLPDRTLPTDAEGTPLHIRSPTADLSAVAAAGRAAGANYAAGLARGYEGAVPAFYGEATSALAPGGRFDFQRSGNQIAGLLFGFEQLTQYRDVSNVNVGLWLQQAGYSLEDALAFAGEYSKRFSGQTEKRTRYGVTELQQYYAIVGWRMGESGAYGPANRLW